MLQSVGTELCAVPHAEVTAETLLADPRPDEENNTTVKKQWEGVDWLDESSVNLCVLGEQK